MALNTRLDSRSEGNRSFAIKNGKGEVLATITSTTGTSISLSVITGEGLYIEKPSGWNSNKQISTKDK